MFRGEVEADGNCQFDIGFSRPAKGGGTMRETCRTFLTCEDVPEVGCRSEFERLIKANRRQLATFDAKAVLPAKRAARSTMLPDRIISPAAARLSSQPLVLAQGSGAYWWPPPRGPRPRK